MIKALFGAVVGAALVVAAYTYGWTGTPVQTTKTETAFERVQRTGELRCGYFSWPPYVVRDPNSGALSGINVDSVEAVAADLGWTIKWELDVGPGEVIAALQTGKIDMMCASLWPDGPRAKNLLLTAPNFYTALYAIVRADDTRFDGDISKLDSPEITLAAIDGDATHNIAKTGYPKAKLYSLPQTADSSQLLLAVADGKADAVIIGLADIESFNATNGKKLRPVADAAPAYVFAESFGLNAGEFQFKATLDSVIDRLNDNGLAQRLLAKYNMRGYFPARAGFAADH